MADYTINAIAVRSPDGVTPKTIVTTVNIDAGKLIYKINSTHAALANANVNANVAAVAGVTVDNAYVGQHVSYVDSGTLALGTTLTAGMPLVVSPNAGMIGNHADLATNHFVSLFAWGVNATHAEIAIKPTGYQRP